MSTKHNTRWLLTRIEEIFQKKLSSENRWSSVKKIMGVYRDSVKEALTECLEGVKHE